MKLYKRTLVSAALILAGLGSTQAATCPVGMSLVYSAFAQIPSCVGVPSKVLGTGSTGGSASASGSSTSSTTSSASGSSTSSTTSSASGSSTSSTTSSASGSSSGSSSGSAAEDYSPVRSQAVTGIAPTNPATPGLLFTDAQVASYLRDNNLISDDYGAQKAAAVYGISPTQLASAKALLVPGNTAGLIAVNSANNGYWNQVNASPGQERLNIEWETAQGLTPDASHLAEYEAKIPGTVTYGQTYTDQQVANSIQANGSQQATSILGVTPEQLGSAQSLITSVNTVTLITPVTQYPEGVAAIALTSEQTIAVQTSNPYVGTQVTATDGTVYNYNDIVSQVNAKYATGKDPALAVKSGVQLGLPQSVIMSMPGVNQTAWDAGNAMITSGAFDTTAEGTVAQAAPVGSVKYQARIAAGLDAWGYPPAEVAMKKAAGTYIEPPENGTGTYAISASH